MTNQKHTPTPWLNEGLFNEIDFTRCYISKDGKGFATTFGDKKDSERIYEDAQFIVKAVNNHTSLLNALKEVKAYLERISCDIPLESQDSNEVADLILEAIEKAEK